ncbi:MAG: chemotaxis protein CheW [Elusimicrobiales bacterium]|nr:chemotaxis protein CheW [Elusimicrobiales bacterium]
MKDLKQAGQNQIVLFTLDEPLYALYLSAVERIVRAVEITPLPKAPGIVLGVINWQGKILPVIDIRKRFHLPDREMDQDDRFIIARAAGRLVALAADSVTGIRGLTEQESASAAQAAPLAEHLKGVAKIDGGLVLICDLDRFLSLDEEQKLDAALSGAGK